MNLVQAKLSEAFMKSGKWRWFALWAVLLFAGTGCGLLDTIEDVLEGIQYSADRDKTRTAPQGLVVAPTLTQLGRTNTPEYLLPGAEISKCNAFSHVELKLVLIRDGTGVSGTRDCKERLEVTNHSDQLLILSKHFVIEDPAYPQKKSRWSHSFLKPGQTLTQDGAYFVYGAGHSQAGKYYTWYTNQIAVTLASCFNPYSIQNIPPATISWFARDVQYHCSP